MGVSVSRASQNRKQLSRLLANAPEDIARIILEFAAQEDRPTAAAIALVSKQANAWITPILYRTVVLTQDSDVDMFNELMRHEKADEAENLRPTRLGYTTALVLLSSRGQVPQPHLMAESCHALRQLHINQNLAADIQEYEIFPPQLRQLVICGWVYQRTCQFIPMYSNLTHLAFFHDIPSSECFPEDARVFFPCLTHFACAYRAYGERAERIYLNAAHLKEDLSLILERVLNVPSLRLAVVLMQDFSYETPLMEQDMRTLLVSVSQKDDSRVVLLPRSPGDDNMRFDMQNTNAWDTHNDDSFWASAERRLVVQPS